MQSYLSKAQFSPNDDVGMRLKKDDVPAMSHRHVQVVLFKLVVLILVLAAELSRSYPLACSRYLLRSLLSGL